MYNFYYIIFLVFILFDVNTMASDHKTIRFAFSDFFSTVLIGDYGKDHADIGILNVALLDKAPSPEELLKSTNIPLSKIKGVTALSTFNPLKVQPFLRNLYSYCRKKNIPCFYSTYIWESCCEALYHSKTMIEKDHHIAVITMTPTDGLVYSILRHNGEIYFAVDSGKLSTIATMTSLASKLKNLSNLDKVLWSRSNGVLKESSTEEKMIRKTFKTFKFTEHTFDSNDYINDQIIDHLLGKSINPYFPAPMSAYPIIQISTHPAKKIFFKAKRFTLPFKASYVLDVNSETSLQLFNGDDSKLEHIQTINVAKFKGKKVKWTVNVDVNYIVNFKVQPIQE